MKVKCVYNCNYLAPGVVAITIYPFIFFKDSKKDIPDSIFRHEMIHVRQVRRLGWLKFYTSYLYHYFKGLIKYRSNTEAYINIPYEVEAYRDQNKIELTQAESIEIDFY